jgi:hypothetical protein
MDKKRLIYNNVHQQFRSNSLGAPSVHKEAKGSTILDFHLHLQTLTMKISPNMSISV